ncbi:MAG: bifunctional tRNA (5-methylaminomethyl-2-thiouridine)(34)-methyltransferase MnmD/FAD-dependent 5-carboxymethylaminomethyl-2-thiouridine(34) oxidoreductase MnmC [Planctomycetes bacterium]|nr:bifunctional tRNA (5-methylaminomethyl-2-thiouridine)(34)-methyltransferase MnmD/FAD-dependent 5-carboxymethylaminomethyl-2-thiouridine(34) oxidoreductase MnmC [Planctomycetota bacterium]
MTVERADIEWKDDTPHSNAFDDIYFSPEDGLAETEYVFLENGQLRELIAQQQDVVVSETGFGTGLNFFATWALWNECADLCGKDAQHLDYISCEKFPLSAEEIQRAMAHWPQFHDLLEEFIEAYPIRRRGQQFMVLADGRIHLHLIFDDIVPGLRDMSVHSDLWYLDGFAPAKNPEMWSEEVCREIARHSKQGTRLTTFTAAGFVRRQLQSCGFIMEKVPGFGGKRVMLCGVYKEDNQIALSKPWFQLASRAQATQKQCIVIGAGLAGSAVANRCAEGGMQVDVFDALGIAAGASGNAIGMYQASLAADDSAYAQYYFSAWQVFRHRLKKIAAEGFNDWDECGIRHVLQNEREQQRAQKLSAFYAQHDKWLRYEKSQGRDSLYIEQAGIVSPYALCHQYMQDPHIQFHQQEVMRIIFSDGQWQVFDDHDRCLAAAPFCVLANAYAAQTFSQTQSLAMDRVRGQLCTFKETEKTAQMQEVLSADAYVTPAMGGKHVLGATFQRGDEDLQMRIQDQEKLLAQAQSFFPHLPSLETLQGRCSLRACGPDRLPIVGQVIDEGFYRHAYAEVKHGKPIEQYQVAQYHPNLYVSTGHGSRGIVGSVLAAEVVYAMMNNQALPVSLALHKAIHPGRFIMKELLRA